MSLSQSAWQSKAYLAPGGPLSRYVVLPLWVATMVCTGCAYLVASRPAAAPPPEVEAEPAPVSEPQPAPPAAAEPRALSRAELAEIRYLLDEADRAIRRNHLTYPAQGSALALYEEVALLEPGNDDARRGLERIVERYLELATDAADQGRFSEADTMLDRARLVDPEHPGIAPVATRVHMLSSAERRVIEVDGQKLRDRDPAVEETLRQAGVASQADGCQAQITARNDSEGRWMYQRMSEAAGRTRIQAQLEIGARPRIEVLCFPPVD